MSARSLNRVMLIGNLTRDPDLRYTPTGTAVCTFGLATNRSWVTNDSTDRQEATEYHRIVAWAKLAEICGQLLQKGRKVYVEGRLQTRKWTTQEGTERETTEVVIDNMIALGAPKNGGSGNYQSDDFSYGDDAQAAAPSDAPADDSASAAAAPESEEINVDDIPF